MLQDSKSSSLTQRHIEKASDLRKPFQFNLVPTTLPICLFAKWQTII